MVSTNYPAGKTEILEAENNPVDPNSGRHDLPFSGELYIEREDFTGFLFSMPLKQKFGSMIDYFRTKRQTVTRTKNLWNLSILIHLK